MSVKKILSFIRKEITPKCYDRLLIYPTSLASDTACLRVILSKVLGYLIVLGSMVVKVPQIVAMTSARSAAGISIASVIVELIAITSTLVYSYTHSFPFSSYGDALFMALQTFAIANLWFYYGQKGAGPKASNTGIGGLGSCLWFSAGYSAALAYLLSGRVSAHVISMYQSFNVPIVLASKGLQIYENVKNSGTGQLSALSFGLITLGALARIFTSIQETGDVLLVMPYIISSILNITIVGQVLYYAKYGKKASTNTNVSSTGGTSSKKTSLKHQDLKGSKAKRS